MADGAVKKISPAFWVPTLYFAEGLPFVTINVVSVLMYKSMKVPDAQIAFFTTLVILPWTLKPLWGPLLKMFKTKKYFVLATQFAGGVGFGLLALSLRLPNFFQYSLAILAIIAFNGATHDIAADGVYINALSEKEQAEYVGWQGAFYNVARVLSQGVFVYIAGRLDICRSRPSLDNRHVILRRNSDTPERLSLTNASSWRPVGAGQNCS